MRLKPRIMYAKDVEDVTQKSSRVCQDVINRIKKKKRIPKHGFITTRDFADHMGVAMTVVHDLMDEAKVRRVK